MKKVFCYFVVGILYGCAGLAMAKPLNDLPVAELENAVVTIQKILKVKGSIKTRSGKVIKPEHKRKVIQLHVAIFNERYQTLLDRALDVGKKNRACIKAVRNARKYDFLTDGEYHLPVNYDPADSRFRLVQDLGHMVQGFNQRIGPKCQLIDKSDNGLIVQR